MAVAIRAMEHRDRDAWARMRLAMWPDDPLNAHLEEIHGLLGAEDNWAFLAEMPDGRAAGFAETSLRKYANGCTEQPVAFLEGIWVEPDMRRAGIGAALIAHLESFFLARGFRELCSDALSDNTGSRAAHRQWGFAETETVVYFRKPLDGAG